MTYKDKWKLENPDSPFTPYGGCPKDENGYDIECPKALNCPMCWEQEILGTENIHQPVVDREETPVIPELKKADEALAKANEFLRIKDSGDRTQFDTGAVRDLREGKGRCDLMPLEVVGNYINEGDDETDSVLRAIREFQKYKSTNYLYFALNAFDERHWDNCYTMLLEVAKHFEDGAKKYGENNWQKGIPVHCYIDSAVRHYLKWLRGDTDEPHDRAFVWNIMCCIWEVDYREKDKKENQ